LKTTAPEQNPTEEYIGTMEFFKGPLYSLGEGVVSPLALVGVGIISEQEINRTKMAVFENLVLIPNTVGAS